MQESNLPLHQGVHRVATGLAPTSQMTFQAEGGGVEPHASETHTRFERVLAPTASSPSMFDAVPRARVELACAAARRLLRPVCLPVVPPPGRWLRESGLNRQPPGYEPGDPPIDLSRDEVESGRLDLNQRSLASDASAIPLRYTLQSSVQTAGGGRRLSARSDAEADCIKLSEREVMESEPPARSDAGRDFT